jgi:hypothetical protein
MNTRNLLVSVLMLVGALLAACAPAATQVAATPIGAPTTVPPTAVTLSTRPFHLFDLPVSVSFDAEWSVLETYKDVFTLRGHNVDLAFIYIRYIKIAGPDASADAPLSEVPFPDDFVTWIQSHGLFQVLETQPVIVGGFQGIQINTNGTSACGADRVWIFLRETDWRCKPGEDIRFILLNDVFGERVLIMTEGPPSAEEFLLGGAAAQKVLDTVSFTKLTTFTSKTFQLPITFNYDSDWSVTEYPNQVYLKNKLRTDGWQLAFNLVADAKIADPNSAAEIPWPQDLVAYLRSNPHIDAGEPMPIIFGGFEGIQIDAYAEYTGDKRTFIRIAGPAEGWLYLDYEEMWRFIVLDDVNGERLVIAMTASPALNEFSVFVDEAQKVLDTVVLSNP